MSSVPVTAVRADSFEELVGPYRAELHAHCYRMLGSSHDAEDALQDALLRAWRGLPQFEGRSSLRSWLYRIATNSCLRLIERRPNRVLPIDYGPQSDAHDDPASPLVESVWIEPYEDAAIADGFAAPEARYERRESVELAFVAALQHLPAPGEAAVLSIETYVREDQIKLFGFRTDQEREWFRLLQTVQGVGAKVALAVLGTLPPADLAKAIALRDKAAVTRTPGVGPKVAERIVTELKDKAPAFANVDPALVNLSGAIDDQRAPRPVTDAISALVNLGYGQPQAAVAVASASRSAGEHAETAQLIRLGLKELAK